MFQHNLYIRSPFLPSCLLPCGLDCRGGELFIGRFNSKEIIRLGVRQAGVITYTVNNEEAMKFIEFMLSVNGQSVFKKYGYLSSEKDAFAFAGKKAVLGGSPLLSKEWIKK